MRCLIVVDVANLYFCAKNSLNGKVDFSKLLDIVSRGRDIYRAVAFGSKIGKESDKFIAALAIMGFTVKFKEPKTWHNTDGSQNRKADWDVAMAMEVTRYAPKVDVVCLVTADGDLAPCVDYIIEQGQRVEVYGINVSCDLKKSASQFMELGSEIISV